MQELTILKPLRSWVYCPGRDKPHAQNPCTSGGHPYDGCMNRAFTQAAARATQAADEMFYECFAQDPTARDVTDPDIYDIVGRGCFDIFQEIELLRIFSKRVTELCDSATRGE